MLRWLSSQSSKRDSVGQKETLRFIAPENASLAQGLLQIILDKAQVEMFSPSGGGVAVMILERWQIDVLADFGVCFEERVSTPPSCQQDEFEALPNFNPEYLSIVDKPADSSNERPGQLPLTSVNDDILSDWLKLEAKPQNVRRSIQKIDIAP